MTTGLAALAALAIAPAAASAAPSPIEDVTFAGGSSSDTWVIDNALRTRPTVGENFSNGIPASGWTVINGTPTVTDGVLVLDGARVESTSDAAAPRTLEFRATFSGSPFQHVGLGADVDDGPWAIFSTAGGDQLTARTRQGTDASTDQSATLAPALLGTSHLFRIEWTPTNVEYFVDGVSVASHTLSTPIAGDMHPLASDAPGAGTVSIDWFAVPPYPAAGTFESQPFEADDARAVWGTLAATGTGGVEFATRTGNSAAAMSAYQPLGTGGAIQSPPGKFIQYRATFTNADQRVTKVSMSYEIDSAAPATTIGGSSVSGTTATVTFSSAAADVARFECSRDGGAFATCTSPATFPGLSPGSHTISVRAIDKVGNVGAPASATVTVAGGTGGSGTPGGGGGGTTSDRKAPKVVVVGSRTLRVGARVPLRLKCPADEVSCEVTVRLKRGRKNASERKTATIDGGATKKVKLRLTDKTRALLIARGKLTVRAVIAAEDAAGNDRQTTFGLTLKPR